MLAEVLEAYALGLIIDGRDGPMCVAWPRRPDEKDTAYYRDLAVKVTEEEPTSPHVEAGMLLLYALEHGLEYADRAAKELGLNRDFVRAAVKRGRQFKIFLGGGVVDTLSGWTIRTRKLITSRLPCTCSS